MPEVSVYSYQINLRAIFISSTREKNLPEDFTDKIIVARITNLITYFANKRDKFPSHCYNQIDSCYLNLVPTCDKLTLLNICRWYNRTSILGKE